MQGLLRDQFLRKQREGFALVLRNKSGNFNWLPMGRRSALIFGVFVWATVVGIGMTAMARYAMTPGQSARAPGVWPAQGRIAIATDRPTLVMFLHPYCACSQSTLEELSQALTKYPNAVAAHIVFFKPHDHSDWADSVLWRSAQSIPGVSVIGDEESNTSLVHAFGALTSGQVLLYGPHRNLLFSGGITGSRGHVGDNDGLDRLISTIHAREGAHGAVTEGRANSPVFGCALDSTTPTSPQQLQEQLP